VTILASDAGEGGYAAGSAASALYRLLASVSSVWTVGTVDVTGTFDLETEKLTLLENINKVREAWGGWLVFDSVNKTISLRDDATWINDTGFELRYRKNEKTLTKTTDWANVITRIYPFGEKDLTIASVNSGTIYLDNTSYTSEVREGIWRREDITSATELMNAATAYLAKVCHPRKQYKSKVVDLRTLSDYSHETLALGDIITIQDEDIATNETVRVIGLSYDVIQPWTCSLTLGDPLDHPLGALASMENL
jgi:phage minor structural protein